MNTLRKNIQHLPKTVLIAVLFVCDFVYPQDGGIQKQIDELRLRLDSVQEETDEMRETLDEIRTLEENWLTEERANQIRLLVRDVLSDADSRSSLVGDGLLGGWSDGFFLASSDGRFKLNIGGLIQERLIVNYLRVGNGATWDRWRGGMENTRTRLELSGHIFDKDTTFLIQPGFGWSDPNAIANNTTIAISARLWDAWVKFKMSESWSAKLGVFMLPFTRESLVSDKYQLAVDRSLIDYRLGLARSAGVQFIWTPDDSTRFFLATSNGSVTLGGFQASPPWGALGVDTDWSATARAEFLLDGEWSQFNMMTSPVGSEMATMVGLAVHAQNGERTGAGQLKQDQVGVTADLSMHFDGATFFMSGTVHNQKDVATHVRNADWVGYVIQASTYMTDTTEAFMRFEGGGIMQNTMGGDDVHILTGGVNWYLDGQGLKVTSDFGWSFGEISAAMDNFMLGWRSTPNQNAEWVFRTQLQLAF
ncbi:MAG: porin [Phycisphaerales bacterium]|jgi:hypothetical protein|nr:porin [Phycisphaerales bacterium]